MLKASFRPTQMANPMQDFPECKVGRGCRKSRDGRFGQNGGRPWLSILTRRRRWSPEILRAGGEGEDDRPLQSTVVWKWLA